MTRPSYCEGKCVNAPEGEPPYQTTYRMVCAGCVREMDRITEEVIAERREEYLKANPGAAVAVAVAERDAARAELAREKAEVDKLTAWLCREAGIDEGCCAAEAVAKLKGEHAEVNRKHEAELDLLRSRMDALATVSGSHELGVRAGCLETVRMLGLVLDGSASATWSFNLPEMTAFAGRLQALKAELEAVHADLGKAMGAKNGSGE